MLPAVRCATRYVSAGVEIASHFRQFLLTTGCDQTATCRVYVASCFLFEPLQPQRVQEAIPQNAPAAVHTHPLFPDNKLGM